MDILYLFHWGILVAVFHTWNVCSFLEMYLLILFTFQLKQMKLKFPKEINFGGYLPRSPWITKGLLKQISLSKELWNIHWYQLGYVSKTGTRFLKDYLSNEIKRRNVSTSEKIWGFKRYRTNLYENKIPYVKLLVYLMFWVTAFSNH